MIPSQIIQNANSSKYKIQKCHLKINSTIIQTNFHIQVIWLFNLLFLKLTMSQQNITIPKPDSSSIQLYKMQNQNYLLRQQMQDIKNQYSNIKKQHQIWEQINNLTPKESQDSKQKYQLTYLKQQFVNIVKEKQILESQLRQMKEKVDDLKYNNIELKQLNEKQQKIHQKQIQFITKTAFNDEKYDYRNRNCEATMYGYDNRAGQNYAPMYNNQNHQNSHSITSKHTTTIKQLQRKLAESHLQIQLLQDQLQRQKSLNTKNQQKLQKCSLITKQMEEYYTSQIDNKDIIIRQIQSQLNRCSTLQSPKVKINSRLINNQECSSLKCSSVVSEYQHQQNLSRGEQYYQIQQKYEQIIQEISESFDKEISKYQNKVRYLILKVEALEAEKKYLQNSTLANQESIQFTSLQHFNHKIEHSINLKHSKASVVTESLSNFTPKSQFSRSIHSINERQALTRQKPSSNIKTPNKSLQKYSHTVNTRNSCQYQRMPLTENNCGY